MKLNKKNFESWISWIKENTKKDRYLLYGFDSPLISEIDKLYSKSNSAGFLKDEYYLFNFRDSQEYYSPKFNQICDIGYSDLVTARSEGKRFIVIVPKLGRGVHVLPSDSSKGTSLRIEETCNHFASFILNNVITEIKFSQHFKQMQKMLENDYPNDCYHFFYKNINSNSIEGIYNFYGFLTHNAKYFNNSVDINKCDYRLKFINRIKDFLSVKSISDLKTTLEENNVSNVDQVIDYFWSEPYDLPSDLGANIDLVFFRNTNKYNLVIDVGEWISALEDKDQIADGSRITYDGKSLNDSFSVLYNSDQGNFKVNKKGGVFIPDLYGKNYVNNGLTVLLEPRQSVNWKINSQTFPEESEVINLLVEESVSFFSINAFKNEKKLEIDIALYDENEKDTYFEDFAFRLKNSINQLIPLKKVDIKGVEFDELKPKLDQLIKILSSRATNNYDLNDFELVDPADISKFKFSRKKNKVDSNSKCIIDLRFISDTSDLMFLGFKETDSSELGFNYNGYNDFYENDIECKVFKTRSFEINEIVNGQLFFKIGNDNQSRWIIIEVETEKSDENDLIVSNSFLKLKASNDSDNKKRRVRIEEKGQIPSSVHNFYFREDRHHKTTYLPTVFHNLKSLNILSNDVNCPVVAGNEFQVQRNEFRPLKARFDKFRMNNSDFEKYEANRIEILKKLKNQMVNNSIDHIQFAKLPNELIDLIADQLHTYKKLLNIDPLLTTFIDTFYICLAEESNLIKDYPLAMFFSPLHPFFLYQLIDKSIIMDNTLFGDQSKLNSICQTVELNVLNHWVLRNEKLGNQMTLSKLETDSLLFTGYINREYISQQDQLTQLLREIKIICNENFGFLSYRQIQSALSKSFDYLSQKPEFNICIEGDLNDQYSNRAILEWVEKTNKKLVAEYENYRFVVNVYDQRPVEIKPYPADNEISYFRNDLGLDINWFKSDIKNYDITILTSQFCSKSMLVQQDDNLLTHNYNYQALISQELTKTTDYSLVSDILIQNSNNTNTFLQCYDTLNLGFEKLFNNGIHQIQKNLQAAKFENSQLLAVSSQISSSKILQNINRGKSLWEYSIADYSYQDSGRGDYYLLAEENLDYLDRFKNLIQEINDKINQENFQKFINYSKSISLFQLSNLLSNSNYLKEFIACVTARKLIDCSINNSNTFVVPYDLYQPRLKKIKNEINSDYTIGGTQFPDFIIVEFKKDESGEKTINFRLVEIKYRGHDISKEDVNRILKDQTSRIKDIFNELNAYRTAYSEKNMWKHTLSIILSEMYSYYHDNFNTLSSDASLTFNEIINSEYTFQLNDSLLIAIDGSSEFKSGVVDQGIYFKVPATEIHEVFDCSSTINIEFCKMFSNAKRLDTSTDLSDRFPMDKEPLGLIQKTISSSSKSVSNSLGSEEIDQVLITEEVQNEMGESEENVAKKETEQFKKTEVVINEMDESKENILTEETNANVDQESIIENNLNEDLKISISSKEVVLGKNKRNKKAVYYPKGRPGSSPLPNYNIMVTGSSGKGKTQFIKSFIYQQALSGPSFTVIDFKNDYSDKYFCKMCNAQKIEVKFDGIPYNPLIPRLGKRDNGDQFYDVSEHINAICAVLANTFGLGIQQEADLKKAVRKVYKLQGINPRGILEYDESIVFPSFNDVGDFLEEGDKELEKLYNRLDPLFDLNLFRDKYKLVGFIDIIENSNIIKVSDIQNDKIKNAIAKMIIVSAHGYYLGMDHSYSLNKLFVFDEAHRILDSNFVEKFIRECRSFGVGLLLSSQQPDDFPENVLGQLATKVIHGNDGDARLTRKIKSLISFKGEDRIINNLETFDAIVNSQDYDNWKVDTLAWPQLILLKIVESVSDGINLDNIIAQSKEKGINKDWEDYLQMLIQKDYIKLSEGLYSLGKI